MGDPDLTHLDERGRATMVDIGDKAATRRTAVASGRIRMSDETRARVVAGDTPKGNVVEVARIAGIQAAKRTAETIPLCHQVPLSNVEVDVEVVEDGLRVRASASTHASTGVEMEALVAVSTALLTLYDMCKALEKGMVIDAVRLEHKRGGRSGNWTRKKD